MALRRIFGEDDEILRKRQGSNKIRRQACLPA